MLYKTFILAISQSALERRGSGNRCASRASLQVRRRRCIVLRRAVKPAGGRRRPRNGLLYQALTPADGPGLTATRASPLPASAASLLPRRRHTDRLSGPSLLVRHRSRSHPPPRPPLGPRETQLATQSTLGPPPTRRPRSLDGQHAARSRRPPHQEKTSARRTLTRIQTLSSGTPPRRSFVSGSTQGSIAPRPLSGPLPYTPAALCCRRSRAPAASPFPGAFLLCCRRALSSNSATGSSE